MGEELEPEGEGWTDAIGLVAPSKLRSGTLVNATSSIDVLNADLGYSRQSSLSSLGTRAPQFCAVAEIGRASCRERVS